MPTFYPAQPPGDYLAALNLLWSYQAAVALADAATISVDISTGAAFDVTIAANRNITFTGGAAALDGKKILLRVKQGGAGGFTLTWDATARFSTDIPSIVLTATAAKTDYIGLVYHNTSGKYDVVAYARGF